MEQDNRDAVIQYLRTELDTMLIWHRPKSLIGGSDGVTVQADPVDDTVILSRVAAAYRKAMQTELGSGMSMWITISDMKRSIDTALLAGDVAYLHKIFGDPRRSMLMYGFDQMTADLGPENSPFAIDHYRKLTYDNLVRVGEAVGVVDIYYPEAPVGNHPSPLDVEEILNRLDAAFGFRVDFPNPYADEFGLQTSRGVASYRCTQAIYQAWLARSLAESSVLEIGGGWGEPRITPPSSGSSITRLLICP